MKKNNYEIMFTEDVKNIINQTPNSEINFVTLWSGLKGKKGASFLPLSGRNWSNMTQVALYEWLKKQDFLKIETPNSNTIIIKTNQ